MARPPRPVRHPKDFWSGAIFGATGLGAILLGRDYPMGTATRMGPGYFPVVLGGLLVVIGLALMARALRQDGPPVDRFALRPLVLVLGSTVLFGLLLRGAGLVVALMVLVLAGAYAGRHFAWGAALALAVGLTVFSVLVFVKALGLPLPVLGPWLGG